MKLCYYCEYDFLFLNIGVSLILLYEPGCREKYHLTLKYPVNLIINCFYQNSLLTQLA